MIGALRRMFAHPGPSAIHAAAQQGDAGFFAGQYAPLTAQVLHEEGAPFVHLTQLEPVARLDADHVVVAMVSPRPRVFGSEVGGGDGGERTHYLVEFDPYAAGMATRVNNFGPIVLDGDNARVGRTLALAAMRVLGAEPPLSPQERAARGLAAATHGDLRTAAADLGQAAKDLLTAGDLSAAIATMQQLAEVSRRGGELRSARTVIETALKLSAMRKAASAPAERGFLLLTQGGILDDLGDPAAVAAWAEASRCIEPPPMRLVCAAHAAGAMIRTQTPGGDQAARDVVAALGPTPDPALLAGLLGAIGSSAGDAGVGYLAQAVWVLTRNPGAVNSSNLAHLERLAARTPGSSPAGYPILCTIVGLQMLLSQRNAAADLQAQLDGVLVRSRHRHGVTADQLVGRMAHDGQAFAAIDPTLRALAAGTPWLAGR